jgi:hypothetical protein
MELHSVDEVNEVVGLGRGVRVVALWPHVLVTTRPLISSYVFFWLQPLERMDAVQCHMGSSQYFLYMRCSKHDTPQEVQKKHTCAGESSVIWYGW